MAGLVLAIQAFLALSVFLALSALLALSAAKTWMPGMSNAKPRFALLPGHDELCQMAPISSAAF
jgi:hypothetical protein